MKIEPLNAPYVIEKGEVDGQVVQLTIRAVEGAVLGYDEVREATKRILEHFRPTVSDTVSSPLDLFLAKMSVSSEEGEDALDRLVAADAKAKGRISDEYLARLSVAYEALAPVGRGVSAALAGVLGKPLPTVKGHIMRARREGFLTEAIEGREGGEATERARELLHKIDEEVSTAKP